MCTVLSWKEGVRLDEFGRTFDRSLELSEDSETDLPLIGPACGGPIRAHPNDAKE